MSSRDFTRRQPAPAPLPGASVNRERSRERTRLVAVLLVAVAAVLARNLQNLAATIDPFDRKILPAAIEKQFLAPTSTPLERNNGRDLENLERRRKGHRRYTYIYIYIGIVVSFRVVEHEARAVVGAG